MLMNIFESRILKHPDLRNKIKSMAGSFFQPIFLFKKV